MATIHINHVTKAYDPGNADIGRAYGRVVGYAGDRPSRKTPSPTDLPNAQKPPEAVRHNALQNVNLEIRNGETIGILGPSGCGKTTLLKVIAGLIAPDEGTVSYDGKDMRDVPPGERRIGIVFQDYALYPHMESRENIGFFFRLHGRADEIPERVKFVSQIMGIGFEALLGRRPPTLSGGERQRVAVARCIARDPGLFLFDEPFSNLDAKLRSQTRVELKRLLNRFRITGVYVTHDQIEAIALCDRLAIMREGRIEQVGTYQRLVERPDNAFVAEFVGLPPMNLFHGHWTSEGWKGADFGWSLPPERRHAEGSPGIVGVRAGHITLAHTMPPGSQGEMPHARVTLIEPMLSEHVLLIYLNCGATDFAVRVPAPFDVKIGDNLAFALDTDHLTLFDGLSGRRLD